MNEQERIDYFILNKELAKNEKYVDRYAIMYKWNRKKQIVGLIDGRIFQKRGRAYIVDSEGNLNYIGNRGVLAVDCTKEELISFFQWGPHENHGEHMIEFNFNRMINEAKWAKENLRECGKTHYGLLANTMMYKRRTAMLKEIKKEYLLSA